MHNCVCVCIHLWVCAYLSADPWKLTACESCTWELFESVCIMCLCVRENSSVIQSRLQSPKPIPQPPALVPDQYLQACTTSSKPTVPYPQPHRKPCGYGVGPVPERWPVWFMVRALEIEGNWSGNWKAAGFAFKWHSPTVGPLSKALKSSTCSPSRGAVLQFNSVLVSIECDVCCRERSRNVYTIKPVREALLWFII